MTKVLAIFFLCSMALSAPSDYKYKEAPDRSYVDDVHYDKDLNVIVIHVHAKAWFINVDQIYGLRVEDATGIDEKIRKMIGDKPSIVRLERVK